MKKIMILGCDEHHRILNLANRVSDMCDSQEYNIIINDIIEKDCKITRKLTDLMLPMPLVNKSTNWLSNSDTNTKPKKKRRKRKPKKTH